MDSDGGDDQREVRAKILRGAQSRWNARGIRQRSGNADANGDYRGGEGREVYELARRDSGAGIYSVHGQPVCQRHDGVPADDRGAEPVDDLDTREGAGDGCESADLCDAHDGRADQQFAFDRADDREFVDRVWICGDDAGDYRAVRGDVVQRVAAHAGNWDTHGAGGGAAQGDRDGDARSAAADRDWGGPGRAGGAGAHQRGEEPALWIAGA